MNALSWTAAALTMFGPGALILALTFCRKRRRRRFRARFVAYSHLP